MPSLQDVQIAGRVLHFQEGRVSGKINLAIVYNMNDASSQTEAATLAGLLGRGLLVGDLVLRPHLVDQASLADGRSFDAVFVAAAVDGSLVLASIHKHRIPCLTRHLVYIEASVCTVAIISAPIVTIVVSAKNAATVGIRFATAFRMMVREL